MAATGYTGVTRNVTSRFIQLRERSFHGQARAPDAFNRSSGVRREDERRLLAGSHDTEMGSLGIGSAPPAWVDLCEELQEEMERIAQKIQELQKMQRQHLLPGFDNENRALEKQRIEAFSREISQSLQQCDISVKRVSASEQVPAQEVRVRSNARTSLATQLHELSRKYRKEHDNYLSKAEQQGGGSAGMDADTRDPFPVGGPRAEHYRQSLLDFLAP